MTHPCCQSCRLRFALPADDRAPCPICGGETIALDAQHALGFQRYVAEVPAALAAAVALRARDPHPDAGWPELGSR